jgi:hypothetical protein
VFHSSTLLGAVALTTVVVAASVVLIVAMLGYVL